MKMYRLDDESLVEVSSLEHRFVLREARHLAARYGLEVIGGEVDMVVPEDEYIVVRSPDGTLTEYLFKDIRVVPL